MSSLLAGDLTTFSSLLADLAPQDDAHQLSLPDDEKQVDSRQPDFLTLVVAVFITSTKLGNISVLLMSCLTLVTVLLPSNLA